MCDRCSDSTFQEQIRNWVEEAKQFPACSRKRNYYLTQIVREISPKLWRTNTPYYADALQQTWLHFARRVCTTYNCDRGCMVAWLNTYLWYRYQDLLKKANEQRAREIPIDPGVPNNENAWFGAVTDVPAPEYGSLSLLEQVKNWVETDPNGVLRGTHLRSRPDVNCQALILLRLPPETPWKDISIQFNVPIPTLSAFYQRKCLLLLREFGQSSGIL